MLHPGSGRNKRPHAEVVRRVGIDRRKTDSHGGEHVMTGKTARRVAAAVGLLLLLPSSRVTAQGTAVAITYAAPDLNHTRLFVNGQNFSAGAVVSLGQVQLTGVVVDVLGQSLTADLPPNV